MQVMGEAQEFKCRGGPLEFVHFRAKRPDGTMSPRKFVRLDDAWASGNEVVVVDDYGQEFSLYRAYVRGLIYLKPILPKKRRSDSV